MAMLEGIIIKLIQLKKVMAPYDVNIFELPKEEKTKIKGLPKSLDEAADALEKDYEFLLQGGAFSQEIIRDQIKHIRRDASKVNIMPNLIELEMYFDLLKRSID